MSLVSRELVGTQELQRVDSGETDETDESAFGSILTTPVDDELLPKRGIQQRLEMSEGVLSYFELNEAPCLEEDKQIQIRPSLTRQTHLVQPDKSIHDDSQREIENILLVTSGTGDLINSPSISSSESICGPRRGSIYTLPNEHIKIESPPKGSKADREEELHDLLEECDESRPSPARFVAPIPETTCLGEMRALVAKLTLTKIFSVAVQIAFFLPWCVAVGGALVLFPKHLEYVAFSPGYYEPVTGIHRFCHWAEYGMSHIAAFLALLALVAWASPTVGVMLTAGLAARFIHTWRPIHLDRNIPLGADDHQTIYLLATTSWWSEAMPNIKKVDDWYYFTGIMEKDDSEESE